MKSHHEQMLETLLREAVDIIERQKANLKVTPERVSRFQDAYREYLNKQAESEQQLELWNRG